MATDEQKKQNQLLLSQMTLGVLALESWNMLGESVFSLSGMMGETILTVFEKHMGLEIAGETPQDVLMEIGRIFVDEFGFCGDIEVESSDDDKFVVKVKNCINFSFSEQLQAGGLEKMFICPVMNSCQAALRRIGVKTHEKIDPWAASRGSIITFTGI